MREKAKNEHEKTEYPSELKLLAVKELLLSV